MVEEFVGSRNRTQILNYAMKEFGTLTLTNKEEALPEEEII